MLRPAAPLAAFLLLTAFTGADRMTYEVQPGRWLVFESLMLDGKYVEENESEFCATSWERRTPADFLAMTARGATCEITGHTRDGAMIDLVYACSDGPVREGKIRVGGGIEDLSVMAEADYQLEDGRTVPAYIDTMFSFDGPCPMTVDEQTSAADAE